MICGSPLRESSRPARLPSRLAGNFFRRSNYAAHRLARAKTSAAGNTPSPTGITGGVFAADINASWEIDLWGRIRRLNESARAQFFASEEARRDVMISLIAQVAQEYFQLLALENEMEIARKTTNSFGQSLKIFSQRLQGGVASKLETSSAEALMHSAASTIPELDRQIALAGRSNQCFAWTKSRPDSAREVISRTTNASGCPCRFAFRAARADDRTSAKPNNNYAPPMLKLAWLKPIFSRNLI